MWNNCRCNHPCPIFCGRLVSCTNDIINPVITNSFGFFNNTTTQTIAAFSTIPVNFVLGEGTSISPSTDVAGAVQLAAGTYEVSYFAEVVLPESGTAEIALELNGATVIGSPVTETGTSGEILTLTQTVMITMTQTSILELVNNTSNSVVVNLASLSIKRL